jgi:predicted DNA-binding transcriptional regulator YafY
VASQAWHSKQKSATLGDGSYVLEIPYADDRELLMDILKFGPDVEVLEPEALRKRVKVQLAAALNRYGNK